MGSAFVCEPLDVSTKIDAISEVKDLIENDKYQFGHGGYTGTFAEAHGVVFREHEFNCINDAEKWLEDTCEKWGPVLIVTVKNNEEEFCIAGICASS